MTRAEILIREHIHQDKSLHHDKKPDFVIAQATVSEDGMREVVLENPFGDNQHYVVVHGNDYRDEVSLRTFPEREPVINSKTYPGENAVLVKDNPESYEEAYRYIEINHDGFPRTIYTEVSQE